jgi:hypothetical protein
MAVALNREWHLQHKMPKNATFEQRVAWHREHADVCSCRAMPANIAEAIAAQQRANGAPPTR